MVNLLGSSDVARKVAEAIHRDTDGNPLFVQEMFRHAQEGNDTRDADGELVRLGLPEGVRDMIGKRLAGLSDNANQILSVASVLGRQFQLNVLQQIAGVEEDEVIADLEEAADRAIVEDQTVVGQGVVYRFSHGLFRELLYDEMSLMRRMRLHQQIARVLEQYLRTTAR